MMKCPAFLVLVACCFGQALSAKDYVLRDLGCWLDKPSSRAIPSIDDSLVQPYYTRPDAIQRCAQEARLLEFNVFAVQDGGWCASSRNASYTYKQYGASNKCESDGKGGQSANQVYEIDTVTKVDYIPIGCFKDQKQRAVNPIEGRFLELHDSYVIRTDAINKCARAAAAIGDTIFAVQNGGWCASSPEFTDKYGPSQDCNTDGKGGPWANNVYKITRRITFKLERLGCFLDKEDRAMPLLDRPEVFEVDDYSKRPHPIEACVRYASGFRHEYIGIQNGGQCLAGKNYDKYGPSNDCGDDSEGGPWANEVYKSSIIRFEQKIIPPPSYRHYYLNNLGCWKDTEHRAIPTLEGDPILIGPYKERKDAIQRCAQAAMSRGYRIIAVQNGGYCSSSAEARYTHRKYGAFDKCDANGKGGPWANQVYEIDTIYNPLIIRRGCFRDTADRSIPTIEGSLPSITGNYQERTDALHKCARAAAFHGYKVFGVQDGGWCASSKTATATYNKYGLTNNCENGKGGVWANSVYQILKSGAFCIVSHGCWADDWHRTIPHVNYEGEGYLANTAREDAIAKCARFARNRRFKFFALQNGGQCATSAKAGTTYKRIGPSTKCNSDGKGGPWANQVYEILHN